jgi:hypothetical protein
MMKNLSRKFPKLHNFLSSADYMGIRFWVFFLLFFAVATPIALHFEQKKKEAYRKSKITWAIVDEVHIGGGKVGNEYINFHFYTKKKKMIKIVRGNFFPTTQELESHCVYDRKAGDTVIIRYSLKDYSYAKIVECYWNNRTKKQFGFYDHIY